MKHLDEIDKLLTKVHDTHDSVQKGKKDSIIGLVAVITGESCSPPILLNVLDHTENVAGTKKDILARDSAALTAQNNLSHDSKQSVGNNLGQNFIVKV